MGGTLVPPLASALLDSNLITTTFYNLKVVQCGSYYQLYFLEKIKKLPTVKNNEFDELNLKSYNEKNVSLNISNDIRFDNIIRSKLSCQRLAKCNSDEWKTFITLTFKENMIDVEFGNREFNKFVSKVRRVFPTFKYISIPEFQKRGAVHYHVLTNINFTNKKLIYEQVDNKKFLHVKFWNNGFTNVEVVSKDIKKIVGYISKYMTKTVDNRLFGHRRYFYSLNLKKPSISYLNLNNFRDKKILEKILTNKSIIYSNVYLNKFDNEKINFIECL